MVENLPKPRIEWKIPIGSLINGALIVISFVVTATVFVSNTTTNADAAKAASSALSSAIIQLNVSDARQDSRLSVLENDIKYIRESLARIENYTKKN